MRGLITIRLALVAPNQQPQPVFFQELLRDVRPEVAPAAPESVGAAACRGLGVAPQQVQHLGGGYSLRKILKSLGTF